MNELRDNFWAVEVPDNATEFCFIDDMLAYKLPNSKPGRYKWLYKADEEMTEIGGEWEIVCMSREATEDDCAIIAGLSFRNVVHGYSRTFFNDLLTSKGCDTKLNWLILKKEG